MEENFALCATKKNNIQTLVLKKKFWTKQKPIPPPPFKLNGRALRNIHFSNGNECVPFYISRSGWPLRYIHISNDNWSFTFYVDFFLSSITTNTFTRHDCIYELHSGCLIWSRNCVPFTSIWVPPNFWWRPCYSSF